MGGFSLIVLLVCLCSTYQLLIKTPYVGIEWESRWIVQSVEPAQFEQGLILPGDRMLKIGSLTYQEVISDRNKMAFSGLKPGDRVTIELLRDGRKLEVVWQMPQPTIKSIFYRLLTSLVAFPFWLIGVFVLNFIYPRDQRWLVLILFTQVTALWFAAGNLSTYSWSASLALHALTWFLLPVYIHLHLIVPAPIFERSHRYLLPILYVNAVIFAFLEAFNLLPFQAYALSLFLAFSGSLLLVIYRTIAKSTPAIKHASRIMLMGIILALGPGIVIWLIPYLLNTPIPKFLSANVSVYAIPILPLFYAYSIYKQYLGVMEIRANKLLGWYVFIILYSAAFGLTIGFTQRWNSNEDNGLIIAFLGTVVFVSLAPYIHNRIQDLVERIAYGEKYDPNDVTHQFTNHLPLVTDANALASLLVEKIMPMMGIQQSAQFHFISDRCIPIYLQGLTLDKTCKFSDEFLQLINQAGSYRPPNSFSPPGFEWVRLVIPLEMQKKTIGLWLFGQRYPDDFYSKNDIPLLKNLANQIALSLENSQLYTELQNANDELDNRVQERTKALTEINLSLASEIEERHKVEEALSQSERHYRKLIELSPEAILVLDEQGIVKICNRQAAILYGVQNPSEMIGKSSIDFVAPESLESMLADGQEVIISDNIHNREYQLLRSDGSRFPGEVNIALIRDEESNPQGYITILRDVSERKKFDQQIRESASRAEALARLTGKLNAHYLLADLLNTVAEETAHALNVEIVIVSFLNGKNSELTPLAYYGIPPAFQKRLKPVPWALFDEAKKLFGPVIIVNDLQAFPVLPNYELSNEVNARTHLIASMQKDENIIGTISAITRFETRNFSQNELSMFQAIADQAAITIENSLLFEQTQRRTRELEALASVSSALRQAKTNEELVTILLERIKDTFQAENASLFLFEKDTLALTAGMQEDVPLDDLKYTINQDPLWESIQAGYPIVLDMASSQIGELTSWKVLQALSKKMRSAVLVPLKTAETDVGLFYLTYAQERNFSEEEIRLLTAIAEIAANAISRTSLMDTLEQRVAEQTRDLSILYEVASLTSQSVELDEILKGIMNTVMTSVHCEAATIHLLGENNKKPHLAYPQKTTDQYIAPWLEWWEKYDFPAWVMQKNQPISTPNLTLDEIIPKEYRLVHSTCSYLGIPIHSKGVTLGLMSIFGTPGQQHLAEQINLLSTISGQIGEAIESASLRQKSRLTAAIEERQRLARELHDSVTQSLYSLTLLAEGYRMAAEKGNLENVGESFTDLVQLSNQVLKEMRLLLYELRPSTIDQDGFVGALHRRLDAVEGRAGIKTRLWVDEDFNLSGQIAEEFYGITQEALNNALKHSHASSVAIHCSRQDDLIELEIKDDGCGFDLSGMKNGGMGLTNMKERAERIGASLNVNSKPGKGAIVKISLLPLKTVALSG